MEPLTDYDDYRKYLRDFCEERRRARSSYSIRQMAGRLGIDHGFLVNILQGKSHLSSRYYDAVAGVCGFDESEKTYFDALVLFNKARSPREKDVWGRKLQQLRQIEAKILGEPQLQFYAKWEHSVVRALVGLHGYDGDAARLAALAHPPISTAQVEESIELLRRLDLVEEESRGKWRLRVEHVTAHSSIPPVLIRGLQEKFLQLSIDALSRTPPHERDISALTLSISSQDLPALRDRIGAFRAEIVSMVDASRNHDQVFQFNVQLFPLSAVVKEAE